MSKKARSTQIRHRHRSRHHQLRGCVRRDPPDADPFAPANVQLLAIPQLTNPGEVRDEDLLPSFLYLPGASDFPAGSIALPWDDAPQLRRRTPGAKARRRKRRPPGLLRQELALALRRRPHVLPAALSRARRRRKDLARGGQPPLPGAYAPGVGRQDAGRALPGAAGAGHRSRVLRRRGARTDAGGRPSRPAIRTSPCSKNRRPPSTPGSNATPIGASASPWAT